MLRSLKFLGPGAIGTLLYKHCHGCGGEDHQASLGPFATSVYALSREMWGTKTLVLGVFGRFRCWSEGRNALMQNPDRLVS